MKILLNDSGILGYEFFYATAIIVAVIILSIQGRSLKFHFLSWVLTFVSCLVVFIIGCTLITFKTAEWNSLVDGNRQLNEHVGASMLGGLLFSIPIIFACKYFYSFSNRMLDAFAFVLPASMAIQRIGCLFAGCCYGNVSRLPWSVVYHDNLASISLHPVQLYESLGCVLVLIAIYYAGRVLKKPGSLFLFSGMCYLTVRFICEFFRTHDIDSINANKLFGLNIVQGILMLVALTAGVIILKMESRDHRSRVKYSPRVSRRFSIIHLSLLILTSLFFSPWLRALDVTIVFGLLSIPCSIFVWQFYKSKLMVPDLRTTIACLLLLSIVMMSQQSSTQHYKTIKTYNTLSFGGSSQQLDLAKQTATSTNDCGTTPIFTYFNVKNTSGAVSIARTWMKENNVEYTLGLNTYVSSVKEEITGAAIGNNNFSFIGFNPSFVTTMKNAEITVGVHVGNLRRTRTDFDPSTSQNSIVGHSTIYPQLGLRAGNPKIFFLNAQFYNSPFGIMPSSPFAIGGGSGFGSKKGNYLEVGHSSFATVYLSSRIAISDKVFIKPFVGMGTGLLNHLENRQGGWTFAVQFSGRFGQKDEAK